MTTGKGSDAEGKIEAMALYLIQEIEKRKEQVIKLNGTVQTGVEYDSGEIIVESTRLSGEALVLIDTFIKISYVPMGGHKAFFENNLDQLRQGLICCFK